MACQVITLPPFKQRLSDSCHQCPHILRAPAVLMKYDQCGSETTLELHAVFEWQPPACVTLLREKEGKKKNRVWYYCSFIGHVCWNRRMELCKSGKVTCLTLWASVTNKWHIKFPDILMRLGVKFFQDFYKTCWHLSWQISRTTFLLLFQGSYTRWLPWHLHRRSYSFTVLTDNGSGWAILMHFSSLVVTWLRAGSFQPSLSLDTETNIFKVSLQQLPH